MKIFPGSFLWAMFSQFSGGCTLASKIQPRCDGRGLWQPGASSKTDVRHAPLRVPAALLLYPIENPATSQTTQDPGTPSRTGQDLCDVQLSRGHTAARGTVKHVTKAEIATTCRTARGALPPLSGCIGQQRRKCDLCGPLFHGPVMGT